MNKMEGVLKEWGQGVGKLSLVNQESSARLQAGPILSTSAARREAQHCSVDHLCLTIARI